MFNRSKISTISGIVGWIQPTNPDYAILNAANLASVSGRFVNENKLIKIEYLKETQDYRDISDEQFNSELEQLQKTSILSVMDRVFNESDYIDRQILYPYSNNKVNTDDLPDGFVGIKIAQDNTKNVAFEITRDILEFEGTGSVTLVLFNSQKKEAIQSKTVEITSSLQEVQLNWRVDNSGPLYKGDLYYGYFTSGVTVKPYNRDYENANIQSNISHLSITNIQVKNTVDTNIFDLDDIENVSECWGLNPDITVFYDFTDLILQNQFLFAYAIQMQCQIQALSYIVSSLRANKAERKAASMLDTIIVEIDGRSADTGSEKIGLTDSLISEIRRVQKELKRIRKGYVHDGIITITRS